MSLGPLRAHLRHGCTWTLAIAALLVAANVGLAFGVPTSWSHALGWLEYDRQAILDGEIWRLATCHLVHWSIEHAALDVGAFLLVGVLYEARVRANMPRGSAVSAIFYPALLALGALCVSVSLLVLRADLATYRGFSGINSAQFAAVLVCEWFALRREPFQRLVVGVATLIFATKVVAECVTGEWFLHTGSLGDLGQPVPLAHAAGSLCGVTAALVFQRLGRVERNRIRWHVARERQIERVVTLTLGRTQSLSTADQGRSVSQ